MLRRLIIKASTFSDRAVRKPPTGARALVAAIAAGACAVAGATRVFEQPEAAYETALADVTLPLSVTGRVTFPPCSGCTLVSLPVSPRTIYLVERAEVPLDALVRAAAEARAAGQADKTAVYIYYDVETRRVNRLVLDHLD